MGVTLVIDAGRCIACGRCELACAVAHSRTKSLFGAITESVPPRSRVTVVERGGMPIPLLCVHCDDPPCAAVCPAGAIEKKETGEVILFEGRCVGCGACAVACHLGVPIPRTDGRAYIKCDLCVERVSEGLIPACAEACKVGAITFGGETGTGERVVYVRTERGKKASLG
jgi:carbon-monoxide dehydrogenase iron sulfur subunit